MPEYSRIEGILDLDLITTKKVVFLGMGSLGSLAVSNMAYPFRQIVLIDPDLLEVGNVERHLLGLSDVGKPKVEGVKRWLSIERGLDPATITVHQGYAQDWLHEHADADLVIVNVDNRRARNDVNAWCGANHIAALYGAIYPMGTGGDIIVIPHPEDVCYQCAAFRIGDTEEYAGKPTGDYGVNIAELVDNKGDLRAVPALRGAVNSLASDMAGFALDLLKGGDVPPQIYVHALEWEPVLNLVPGPELNSVGRFVAQQTALGLISTAKLGKLGTGGGYALSLERSGLSLAVNRWSECELHTNNQSLEDI